MSRHLTFTEGSTEVRVRCFLHSELAGGPGWYDAAERTIRMPRPVSLPG